MMSGFHRPGSCHEGRSGDAMIRMTSAQKQLVDRYEKGIETVEAAFAGTPAGILDVPPAPGKWSIRQIVVHVADADIAAAMRYRQLASGPGAKLIAWDQDVWADKLRYSEQSAEYALQAFSAI